MARNVLKRGYNATKPGIVQVNELRYYRINGLQTDGIERSNFKNGP